MGPESRMLLQQALQSSDAAVRMRALHLLMSAAAQAPDSMHTLRTSGTAPNQPLKIVVCNSLNTMLQQRKRVTSLGLVYIWCCLKGAAE